VKINLTNNIQDNKVVLNCSINKVSKFFINESLYSPNKIDRSKRVSKIPFSNLFGTNFAKSIEGSSENF
jgi:hypothetical protein